MQAKQESINEKKQASVSTRNSGGSHYLASLSATTIAHMPRVMMNRAAYHTQPMRVIADLKVHWKSGFFWNLLRGTIVFGSQSWARQQVSGQDDSAFSAKAKGIFAAAFIGAGAASFVETPFIRATLRSDVSMHSPLMRFSLPLSLFYFTREVGFTSVSLGAEDFPSYIYWPLVGVSTVVTAVCHKFATWEATTDLMKVRGYETPNFKRDGFLMTLTNIAKGNVYTHDSCKAKYSNPVTSMQYMWNFVHVTSHWNMLIFRALFLGVFTAANLTSKRVLRDQEFDWMKFSFFKKQEHKREESTEHLSVNKAPART